MPNFFFQPLHIFVAIPFLTALAVYYYYITGLRSFLQIKKLTLASFMSSWILSLFLWLSFDETTNLFQKNSILLYSRFLVHFDGSFYLDGISLLFLLLTAFIFPLCIIFNWNEFDKQKLGALFLILLLVLEGLLFACFLAYDIFVFYVCFELTLIPMFLIILLWGSRSRKVKAAYYFFFFTLTGSLLMLLAIIFLYFEYGCTSFFYLVMLKLDTKIQLFLWLAFFASFAVKIPMFPFHLWLPEAHVEAPTVGSVILAGILLKLGGYGFLRFSIPFFPEASEIFAPLIYTLSLLGLFYASFTAIRQIDLKRIIAYSSIAHMSMVTMGLFSLTFEGMGGAIFLMFGHGLVSSALFFLIGILYNRYHTRLLYYYGGLAQVMPIFAIIFFFFTLANISFPGTVNFISEFLVFVGLIFSNFSAFFLASFGILFSAIYSFWLYNRIMFGDLKLQYFNYFLDINKREFIVMFPLVFLTIYFGLCPNGLLNLISTSLIALFFE